VNRRSREKKARKQGAKRSGLSDHRREGKLLLPPLRRIPQLRPMSWMNDRLPELIWAALLATQFPRETVVEIFRSVADRIHRAGEGAPHDLRLTGLAMALPASRELIIDFVSGPVEAKEALSPLLLFPDLPGREAWSQAIGRDPGDSAWPTLANAVAQVLDHQSETATDLRWAVLLCLMAAGRLHFPKHVEHIPKELSLYPYLGDQRKVRPTIRASEGALVSMGSGDSQATWAPSFWSYCFTATPCFPLPITSITTLPTPGTTVFQVSVVTQALLRHCTATHRTSAVDPRHDTVFGMALYSLAVLSELMHIGANTQISARFGLRALLEVYVTIAYLLAKDAPDLWSSYRVYGSGQAKLAALKLDEAVEQPLSISNERLREIANEDVWEEFLDIDLGHWTNANLRQLSMDAGVKDDYDRFYSWTSMYIHGHWGAVRSTVFDTCGNPLHRLHRIPRSTPQVQPDVVADAVELVDKTLALVDRAYPSFGERLKV
jgi:hypothetical protein